jgi:26S proteasome regulatory subunit T4
MRSTSGANTQNRQPDTFESLMDTYVNRLKENKEMETRLKSTRQEFNTMRIEADKLEDNLKAIQNSGQLIGEILKNIDTDKCMNLKKIDLLKNYHLYLILSLLVIVKLLNGPRYVVTCKKAIDQSRLKVGTRIALDFSTLTIMRILPREVDPVVFNMMMEDPGNVPYSEIGGLGNQIRDLRETVELPLTNPELFKRIGIKPPKGVLLYGPPGTGKTLLARAIACNIDAKFLKIVASSIVDKYIGESARVIREMFGYAKENQPCIIFIDEIDAIGGKRMNEGSSADREIQRTLMELLNQMDGFDDLGKVKVVMATNRPDVLDPALLRPGRLDRKIEIALPNESGRVDILKIHSKPMTKKGEVDFEAVSKLCDGFNGADLRNVCTEAGMFAIRQQREYTVHDDFMKAARKIKEAKALENKIDYSKV